MNPCVVIYKTKKKRLSKEQAMLFYRHEGYISIDYFYKENDKWVCYGGSGLPADAKTRLTCFPVLISSCLKKERARNVKRLYSLTQVRDFTKKAKCDCLYWWNKEEQEEEK